MARKDSAFFGTLCFSMRHIWDDQHPTAGTDGRHVFWNPDFFMGRRPGPVSLRDRDERLTILVHECMHPAYQHMNRKPAGANHRDWNIACDHVINLQLKARGFKVPDWMYCDSRYEGMTAEEVYNAMPKGLDLGLADMFEMPVGDDLEDLLKEIEENLIRARLQSQLSEDSAGTIPGEVEIFLNKLLCPKLPWHRILQRYLLSFAKNDFDWRKPNRRHFPENMLPTRFSLELIDLAIWVDTSGSISNKDFFQFVSETHQMLRMMKPKKITFGQFDTKVQAINEVTDIRDLMALKFTGRGGTDINPCLQWAVDNKPQLQLIFTDGAFSAPTVIPNTRFTNVIWIIFNNPRWQAPFGKVIYFDL
jgi:predicted metal-dependent peptidase